MEERKRILKAAAMAAGSAAERSRNTYFPLIWGTFAALKAAKRLGIPRQHAEEFLLEYEGISFASLHDAKDFITYGETHFTRVLKGLE